MSSERGLSHDEEIYNRQWQRESSDDVETPGVSVDHDYYVGRLLERSRIDTVLVDGPLSGAPRFIDHKDYVCRCGHFLKIVSAASAMSPTETFFQPSGIDPIRSDFSAPADREMASTRLRLQPTVDCFAASATLKMLAYASSRQAESETARVYVHTYPGMRLHGELAGIDVQLVSMLEFSESEFLAGFGHVPSKAIFVWFVV